MDDRPAITRLTHTQRIALSHLANGSTISDAAAAAGVDRSTCSKWQNNALFALALRELRHSYAYSQEKPDNAR